MSGICASWSLLGHAGLSHPFANGLKLDRIRRIVAIRRPVGVGARNGEADGRARDLPRCGTRIVRSTEPRRANVPITPSGAELRVGRRSQGRIVLVEYEVLCGERRPIDAR